MTHNPKRDDLMSLYILGELSEQEQEAAEKEYFADDDYFAQLLFAEDALIDRYLRGELNERERAQFTKVFLSDPRKRRRVEAYRSLTDPTLAARWLASEAVQPAPSQARTSWRESLWSFLRGDKKFLVAAVALFVVVILGGLWMYLRPDARSGANVQQATTNQPQSQENRPDAPSQVAHTSNSDDGADALNKAADEVNKADTSNTSPTQNSNQPASNVQRQSHPPHRETTRRRHEPTPLFATITLIPGTSLRGGASRSFPVQTGVERINFELGLMEHELKSYRAVLKRMDGGGTIQEWRGLKARPRAGNMIVTASLPASQITNGLYELTLYGVAAGSDEEVENYQFRISKAAEPPPSPRDK